MVVKVKIVVITWQCIDFPVLLMKSRVTLGVLPKKCFVAPSRVHCSSFQGPKPYKARCGHICLSLIRLGVVVFAQLLSPLEKNEHALGLVARLQLHHRRTPWDLGVVRITVLRSSEFTTPSLPNIHLLVRNIWMCPVFNDINELVVISNWHWSCAVQKTS